MQYRNYTKADLISAVKSSTSIRQVLKKIGLVPVGGNYLTIKLLCKKDNISISHFTGQAWNRGKTFGPKRLLSEYLSNKYRICSDKLRKRLIREGLFERKCYKCERTMWNNLPIPLELEHINGHHLDNSLGNLTILCPNCHAQTPTYRRQKK